MKSLKIYMSIMIFSLGLVSCEVQTTNARRSSGKSLPPGQAKKIYGTKSAKPFAPGQNK